jgi:eukaryotic-like serine/threonine-protein kinase
MGCVYRVRHRVLGRLFALKALRPDLACDFALAERFVQEARAAAAISHPNVVGITDFGMLDDGQPYFVMELLEGRTLSSWLRERGVLEPEQVVLIARTVACALAAAHEVGVIHRDLKPDNVILLGEAMTKTSLKVLDFGLAKLQGTSRVTCDDIVYGTPQYMSPEQAAGESIDPRVDVYALGILMYEMLTGRVPFEADSYMGVLTKQLYVEPIPPSVARPALRHSKGLEDIVLCCLHKEREARFSGMHAVIEALDGLGIEVGDRTSVDSARTRIPVPMRPQQDSRVVRRKTRRLRVWTYASAGVAALGVALVLLFGRLSGNGSSVSLDASSIPRAAHLELRNTLPSTVSEPRGDSSLDPGPAPVTTRDGSRTPMRAPAAQASASRSGKRDSGRSTGRLRGLGTSRTETPAGVASGDFVAKDTPGSSEIANPWAK